MKNLRIWSIPLALVLAITIGASAVFAADSTAPPQVDDPVPAPVKWGHRMGQPGDHGPGDHGPGDHGPGDHGPGELRDELLANALGITVDELKTARTDAHALALDQAVADGYVTEAMAEKLSDRPMAGFFILREWYDQDDAKAFLAQALGITVEELEAAYDNAIPAGVEAGIITQEEANRMITGKMVAEAVRDATDQALQDAVDQGLITQEEADAWRPGQGPGAKFLRRGFSPFGPMHKGGPGFGPGETAP